MIVGIDLGTTNSLIGAMDSGFPVLFADAEGHRLTPSAVYFPEEGEPLVGRAALNHREKAILSVKRLMGQPGGNPSPEEISALILKKLKADAERALGQSVDRAVITVPAYFNDAQRAATKRAGELAGLTVERLLAEPTAAALAYGLDRLDEKSKVVVYDFGGGTFDVSVLELSSGVFHVLSTNGDTRLGGDDLDAALSAERGVSLLEAAELKKDHSAIRNSQAAIAIIERTRAHCLRSLHDAGLKTGDIDEVILVGGVTRMPLVREFVREVFGREANVSQHPDEAVALGAVIQAGILDGSVQNITLLDVTPLSLGIETFGGLMNVLIPRNTTIPCKAGEMFTNAAANQASMRISVLQGEREMAKDNWRLGEFDLPFAPAPRGQARVGVQFELDANGLLHVLARDVATGLDTKVEIRSAVEVSDEAVEKMLADSLEHAFEDMDDRQFAEACLKADEMLPAVEAALQRLEISPAERDVILGLVQKVQRARDARSLQKLKSALNELDRETEPLAARLIEGVMEGRL
ncbi:MAG: Hsp70 family protein [Terrimicrobiaceae bacterium]